MEGGKKEVFSSLLLLLLSRRLRVRRKKKRKKKMRFGTSQRHKQQVITYCQTQYDYKHPKMPLKLAV